MRLDFLIDGNNFDMAGEASSSVKRTLTKLGVAPPLVKRAAISMYEAEINAFIHGGVSSKVHTLAVYWKGSRFPFPKLFPLLPTPD